MSAYECWNICSYTKEFEEVSQLLGSTRIEAMRHPSTHTNHNERDNWKDFCHVFAALVFFHYWSPFLEIWPVKIWSAYILDFFFWYEKTIKKKNYYFYCQAHHCILNPTIFQLWHFLIHYLYNSTNTFKHLKKTHELFYAVTIS